MFLVVDFAADKRAKASQVSTYLHYRSNIAIDDDGDLFGCQHLGEGSFTHTKDEWYPWWQVDLGTFIDVRSVMVTSRCK